MTAKMIIDDLKKQGHSLHEIKAALCDGEWLRSQGYDDNDIALIEEAFNIVLQEIRTGKEF
ncbi:MAG TPA: hypothetical protein PKX12_11475 [Spirochaetota bacterium]|nr:hypothetical protein [Spirochaetota bacterium]